jgi:hypothetical protein
MTLSKPTLLSAVLAAAMLGATGFVYADEALDNWPVRADAQAASQRRTPSTDMLISGPSRDVRQAEVRPALPFTRDAADNDAFYYRQFGGVSPP